MTESALARKFRKARSLSLREWGWFFEAYAVLTATKLQLLIAPRSIVERAVAKEDVPPAANPTAADINERMVSSFAMATGVHFLRPNCLPRSLSLWRMLRRRGIDAVVRIGAKMSGRRLDGHAWVEVDGKVVNDRPDVAKEFTPLRLGGTAVEEWLKNAKPD
jgi:hypothetical protein